MAYGGDWPPKKNAEFLLVFPIYDADGDLVTGAADLDSEVSKDGGTFADCSNEASEIATSSGLYKLTLTATEMNADVVAVITKTSTSGAKTAVNVIYTVTRQTKDLAWPAISGRSIQVETDGMVHSDLKEWLGVAPLALLSQKVQVVTGIVKNVAFDNFSFLMVLSSDHATPATGKSVTGQISKDGGAFAACANSVSEIGNGGYKINFTQAEMNADVILLKFTATGCDQRTLFIVTNS